MNTKIKLPCLLAAGLLGLAGCPGDDTGGTGDGTDTDTATNTMTASSTMSSTTASTTESSTTPMTDTMTETETTPMTDTDTDTTGPNPDVYDFRDDDPALYTQVDRMGLPAINTVLIFNPGQKDNYNQSPNVGNKDGVWSAQFDTALTVLHRGEPVAANGDDAFGLNDEILAYAQTIDPSLNMDDVVCYHDGGGSPGACVTQLFDVVSWVDGSGDSLGVDTEGTAGFPNGRAPWDVVIDPILDALLLNTATFPNLDVFTGIPLNPTANTEGMNASFPYLVDAN